MLPKIPVLEDSANPAVLRRGLGWEGQVNGERVRVTKLRAGRHLA